MKTEERVKDNAIYWLASHYTISTGAIHIVSAAAKNQDDWRVLATCTKFNATINVQVMVFCTSYIFDVLDCKQIGAGA